MTISASAFVALMVALALSQSRVQGQLDGLQPATKESKTCLASQAAKHLANVVVQCSIGALQLLLEDDDVDVNKYYFETAANETALLVALRQTSDAKAWLLLERNVDVTARNKYGWNPLHYAAIHGHASVVSALQQRGSDVNAADTHRWTPLHHAVFNGHESVASALQQSGADVNATEKYGCTPLHYAAERDRRVAAKMLLQNDAHANAKNQVGQTPLHVALLYGRDAIVTSLIENGADVNAKDSTLWTPLHCAVLRSVAPYATALLQNGANANSKDNDGWTPLHYAARFDDRSVVAALLQNHGGADDKDSDGTHLSSAALVNARASKSPYAGWTALHMAALRGSLRVIQLLVDNRADASLRTDADQTALSIAHEHGHADIVAFFSPPLLG